MIVKSHKLHDKIRWTQSVWVCVVGISSISTFSSHQPQQAVFFLYKKMCQGIPKESFLQKMLVKKSSFFYPGCVQNWEGDIDRSAFIFQRKNGFVKLIKAHRNRFFWIWHKMDRFRLHFPLSCCLLRFNCSIYPSHLISTQQRPLLTKLWTQFVNINSAHHASFLGCHDASSYKQQEGFEYMWFLGLFFCQEIDTLHLQKVQVQSMFQGAKFISIRKKVWGESGFTIVGSSGFGSCRSCISLASETFWLLTEAQVRPIGLTH